MEPKIEKIEETSQTDTDGNVTIYKQVIWSIGDDGPFYILCPAGNFDVDRIIGQIKDEARSIKRLRQSISE